MQGFGPTSWVLDFQVWFLVDDLTIRMMLKLFVFAGTVSPSLCFLSRCSLLLCLFCSPNSLYWVLLPVSRYSWFVLACFLLVLSCCLPLSLCCPSQLCVLCVTPGLLDVWIPWCFEISLLLSKISIKGSLYVLLLCPESPTACCTAKPDIHSCKWAK